MVDTSIQHEQERAARSGSPALLTAMKWLGLLILLVWAVGTGFDAPARWMLLALCVGSALYFGAMALRHRRDKARPEHGAA